METEQNTATTNERRDEFVDWVMAQGYGETVKIGPNCVYGRWEGKPYLILFRINEDKWSHYRTGIAYIMVPSKSISLDLNAYSVYEVWIQLMHSGEAKVAYTYGKEGSLEDLAAAKKALEDSPLPAERTQLLSLIFDWLAMARCWPKLQSDTISLVANKANIRITLQPNIPNGYCAVVNYCIKLIHYEIPPETKQRCLVEALSQFKEVNSFAKTSSENDKDFLIVEKNIELPDMQHFCRQYDEFISWCIHLGCDMNYLLGKWMHEDIPVDLCGRNCGDRLSGWSATKLKAWVRTDHSVPTEVEMVETKESESYAEGSTLEEIRCGVAYGTGERSSRQIRVKGADEVGYLALLLGSVSNPIDGHELAKLLASRFSTPTGLDDFHSFLTQHSIPFKKSTTN